MFYQVIEYSIASIGVLIALLEDLFLQKCGPQGGSSKPTEPPPGYGPDQSGSILLFFQLFSQGRQHQPEAVLQLSPEHDTQCSYPDLTAGYG